MTHLIIAKLSGFYNIPGLVEEFKERGKPLNDPAYKLFTCSEADVGLLKLTQLMIRVFPGVTLETRTVQWEDLVATPGEPHIGRHDPEDTYIPGTSGAAIRQEWAHPGSFAANLDDVEG